MATELPNKRPKGVWVGADFDKWFEEHDIKPNGQVPKGSTIVSNIKHTEGHDYNSGTGIAISMKVPLGSTIRWMEGGKQQAGVIAETALPIANTYLKAISKLSPPEQSAVVETEAPRENKAIEWRAKSEPIIDTIAREKIPPTLDDIIRTLRRKRLLDIKLPQKPDDVGAGEDWNAVNLQLCHSLRELVLLVGMQRAGQLEATKDIEREITHLTADAKPHLEILDELLDGKLNYTLSRMNDAGFDDRHQNIAEAADVKELMVEIIEGVYNKLCPPARTASKPRQPAGASR